LGEVRSENGEMPTNVWKEQESREEEDKRNGSESCTKGMGGSKSSELGSGQEGKTGEERKRWKSTTEKSKEWYQRNSIGG